MRRVCRRYGCLAALIGALLSVGLPSSASATAGDIFVVDQSAFAGSILKLGPSGGAVTPLATGLPFIEPESMVWVAPRTMWVADDDASAVFQIDTVTGARSTIASGPPFGSPTGITRAPDGSIYVSDTGVPDAVYRIDPATHAVTTVHSGDPLEAPREIAATRQGFAYLADQSLGAILKLDLATGAVSTVTPDTPLLSGANRIVLTPDEKTLYVSNRLLGNPTVTRVDLATGTPSKLVDADAPGGLGLLTTGKLLLGETSTDVIQRITTAGAVDTFSSDPAFEFPWDILPEPGLCGNRFPTVSGTDAPEVLTGTPFKDVIDGKGGADQISGLGAKDVLCGGGGKDRLVGGAKNDQLFGQKGKDKLIASKGAKDICNGGAGKDTAKGCEKTRKLP